MFTCTTFLTMPRSNSVVFDQLKGIVIGAFRATDEQIILVQDHHTSPPSMLSVSPFLGRKFIYPVEVDGFAVGFQAAKNRVAAEDEAGQEVFAETGGFVWRLW
jgi:hypothetical protein